MLASLTRVPETHRTNAAATAGPAITTRAAAARETASHYGYEEVNAVVEQQLDRVPDKYRHDPDEHLRSLYEEVLSRPPSDEDIAAANSKYRNWRSDDDQWHALLCELCMLCASVAVRTKLRWWRCSSDRDMMASGWSRSSS